MGLEPILYELMRLVSLPLDYSAMLVVVLGVEPRIEESKSSVLPLHYTRMEPLTGVEPVPNVYKTLVLAIKLKWHGAVGRIRTSEAISDRFTVCCLYPS